MTNIDMLREIEERLGSEGSAGLAELMFDELREAGAIGFDAMDGFYFVGEGRETGDFPAWDTALAAVIAKGAQCR